MKTITDPNVQAAAMVAGFAQELGLPPGNLWEPPMVRKVAAALADSCYAVVEVKYRFTLGLEPLIPVSR